MAEGGTVQQALGLLGGGCGRGKCVMHTEDTVQQALRVLGDGWGARQMCDGTGGQCAAGPSGARAQGGIMKGIRGVTESDKGDTGGIGGCSAGALWMLRGEGDGMRGDGMSRRRCHEAKVMP